MEESALEAAGVPQESIFVLPEDEDLRIENLLVAPRGVNGNTRIVPAAVNKLRAIAASTGELGRRLYVSRRGARRRGVANEAEMLDVLSQHGFEEIQPGELSVGAQAMQFARASVILGMHGAGLANAVFAPTGATVVELQPSGLDRARIGLYWNLAAAAGHEIVQVICREAGDQNSVRVKDRDIAVDLAQLDRVLATLPIGSKAGPVGG